MKDGKPAQCFERYAIVNRTDMDDAMRKLEQTEKALEQAPVTIGHENGHAAQQTADATLQASTPKLLM